MMKNRLSWQAKWVVFVLPVLGIGLSAAMAWMDPDSDDGPMSRW
jgi:hypothetical protein